MTDDERKMAQVKAIVSLIHGEESQLRPPPDILDETEGPAVRAHDVLATFGIDRPSEPVRLAVTSDDVMRRLGFKVDD